MNYGEIKQNLISLGFAEDVDYQEYEELGYTYDAINRAISIIGNQFPYVAKYEFEIDEEDTGIMYIDMTDRPGFLSLAETPVLFEENGTDVFTKFGDYQIEMGHTLVIDPAGHAGSIRIYYNKECTQVNPDTDNSFVPEIPLKAHPLIPLLASYYLWLDDDPAKAAQYFNMYETDKNDVMQKDMQPSMRIAMEWGGI